MNRYEITNQRDGKIFVVVGEKFPDTIDKLWGLPARTKRQLDCDTFEISRATNPRPGDTPEEIIVDLPADFIIVTTFIDPEITAASLEQAEHDARIKKLNKIKKTDLDTLDKCAQVINELTKALKHLVVGAGNTKVKKTADCTSAELLQAIRFFTVSVNGVLVEYCQFSLD